jgi:UDP-glucose 4-epimerase
MTREYLVTGGTGFIGNELVRQLKGASVAMLDNLSRVAPRIDDLEDVPRHRVDLVDHDLVMSVLQEVKPRVVFHLAAIHFIPECNANPERTLRVNVEATMGLLRACSKAGVEHVVFASSGAVYADSAEALSEAAAVAPVDIYGWTKLQAEQLCQWHAQMEGIRVTACRIFNNYGPRETNAHIIPEILQQLRNGNTLHLGNVTPRRDYVHTSDTAKALRLLAEQPLAPGSFRVVNVASGQNASVEELVTVMSKLLGRDITIVRDAARFRKADKEVQVADTSLLKSLTGWSRQIEFQDGLRSLLEFEGLLLSRNPDRSTAEV